MLENKIFKITITLKSGLHIGGSSDEFDIGGVDSTVIKNPITKQPYIPGSSLKGKIRSMLTYKYGEVKNDNVVFKDENKKCAMLFEPMDQSKEVSISRAIFRDAHLTTESAEKLQSALGYNVFTSVKAENSINKLNGKAANPRFIEVVPAGAVFEGEIVLMSFAEGEQETLETYLKEGIHLLETNYLGGSGTRGYGRVSIDIKEI